MKVELMTDEKGICKEAKINGIDFGKKVTKLIVEIVGGQKPILKYEGIIDELIFEGEDVMISNETGD